MISLQPQEFAGVAQYIYSVCSVSLDDSKGYLIESRLAGLVEEAGCRSYRALVERAKTDPTHALERRVVDAITTNETYFFRDTAPFDLLRHKIIPDIIDRSGRAAPIRIRIWSAACSTGQELYSIAFLLRELLGDSDRYDIRLMGTDISDDAVARASRGQYNPIEISRGLSDAQRARYFVSTASQWQVRDDIRAMVSFRRLNLMADFAALGRFDVIFCRNVAIYFTERDRISLFGRIGRVLEPEGCLIIGALESLNGLCPEFESKRHLRAVYYQTKATASAAYLGASRYAAPRCAISQ